MLAEGADGSSMTRTINMANVLDDVMVAYGMNGENARPRTATRCAWWCLACRASWVKYLRRISKWATSPTPPRMKRFITST